MAWRLAELYDPACDGDVGVNVALALGVLRDEINATHAGVSGSTFRSQIPYGRPRRSAPGPAQKPGGRIAEEWASYDALSMLRQLGAIPAPG